MQFDQNRDRLAKLLAKFVQGTLDEQERHELDEWINESPENEALASRLKYSASSGETYQFFASLDTEHAWQKITSKTRQPGHRSVARISRSYWWYSAAAVLFILFSGSLLFTYIDKGAHEKTMVTESNRLPADPEKAILQLDNHTVLVLDDHLDGVIYEKEGLRILKNNQVISYHADQTRENAGLHTLSTPYGSQYEIILPDKSKLFLNAATSVSFPAYFPLNQRFVQLKGEAYFDVAAIPDKRYSGGKVPFKVTTEATTVEVLGTQFNLSAYDTDSRSKTTLIEGSVKVSVQDRSVVLQPGEQAVSDDNIRVSVADIDEAISWKRGYFQFENYPLDQVLLQLQRWYGFELDPGLKIPDKHFSASISMDKPLSTVLGMLEASSDLRFTLVNQRLRITE